MLLAAKLARWGDRLLTLAAALLLGALALFGAWSLWDIAATRRAALPEQTLRFKPLAAAPADSPGFAELRALNPDVCGWLTLDGTRIDFPVVQGADNMVYVNTDVYGDFSLSGAIFLDSRCPADFTAPYSIVYGHHIEDGGMFGDIVQFTQSDYFAAHTTGTLITDDTAYDITPACGPTPTTPCSTTPPKARTHCWPTSRRTRCSTARRAAGRWWPFPPAPRPLPTAGCCCSASCCPKRKRRK